MQNFDHDILMAGQGVSRRSRSSLAGLKQRSQESQSKPPNLPNTYNQQQPMDDTEAILD